MIAPILARRDALGFWGAVLLTGLGTGLGAAALTGLLELVQHTLWSGNGVDLLDGAAKAAGWWHIVVLLGAGLLTGAGQLLLVRLSAANSIDITTAIWFHAGRLPTLRTLGSAVLSILVVGMGASLGREGAPKQAGAVIGNLMSDRVHLSDEQRRLLVACGAGAGMSAAYGVPLGGALFALEVLRGELALRFVLPTLMTSLIATGVSWIFLPNTPTYQIPAQQVDLEFRTAVHQPEEKRSQRFRFVLFSLVPAKSDAGIEVPADQHDPASRAEKSLARRSEVILGIHNDGQPVGPLHSPAISALLDHDGCIARICRRSQGDALQS